MRPRVSLKRRLLGGVAVVAAAALALTGCGASTPTDEGPSTLTIGVTLLPKGTQNPLNGNNPALSPAAQGLYEPLIDINPVTNEFEPVLAEEYSFSDDRRTMYVTLRQGIEFVDGEPLNAAAVEKFFAVATQTDTWVQYASIGQAYGLTATATGEYTLEFTTTKPMGRDFMSAFYTGIASPAGVDDPASLDLEANGTGPYILVDEVPDVSLTFERNPNYWNPEAYEFDEITFIAFSDDVAALNALSTGQIDAAELGNNLAAQAEKEGFRLNLGSGTMGTLLVFDIAGEKVPALGDVRVRQAMNLAFDRDAIEEILDAGFGIASSQPFAPNTLEYVEGGDDRYAYDVAAAKKLLAEAGYPDGFDLTIPVTRDPAFAGITDTVEFEPVVKQFLDEIGIRVTYQVEDDLFTRMMMGEFAIGLFHFHHCCSVQAIKPGGAFSTIADERSLELADLIENGTTAEYEQGMKDLGEYILDEAWFVPFSTPNTIWASRKDIEIKVGTFIPFTYLRYMSRVD